MQLSFPRSRRCSLCPAARSANHRSPAANATPDTVIERLRHRFVGHDVYGYGGIAISCPPQWTRFYGPATPIRVSDVQREHAYTTLATGVGTRIYGPGFDDSHAVRFVFSLPRAVSAGVNYHVPGIAGPCPALDLSEFQIPISLSIDPPPLGALSGGLRVGMTRADMTGSSAIRGSSATSSASSPSGFGITASGWRSTTSSSRLTG